MLTGPIAKAAALAGSALGLVMLPTVSAVFGPLADNAASPDAAGATAAPVVMASTSVSAPAVSGSVALSLGGPRHSHPEALLLGAIDTFRQGDVDGALRDIESLVQAKPNFRLAHLVYGDLLASRTGLPVAMAPESAIESEPLAGLVAEAQRRWQHSNFEHDGRLPSSLLRMAPDQSHGVVVDLTGSRLYLFENRDGEPSLIGDYYVSGGKNGPGKERKGDKKTPIGVYFVTSRLLGDTLPDKYGPMAFPVDYPNAWDLRLGRTGDGIWLHGVASNTYSRPPLDSDGCVAMTNEELSAIEHLLEPGRTPVVIGEAITWLEKDEVMSRRDSIETSLEGWRSDWQSGDTEAYLAHYSDSFSGRGMDKAAWSSYKRRVNANKAYIRIGLSDLSVFTYPQDDLAVISFRQTYESDTFNSQATKRQFWQREADGRWRIISEATL